MRKEYPLESMKSHEILNAQAQVLDVNKFKTKFFFQGAPDYNAYRRDIAVLNLFFGDSTAFGKDDKQRLVLSFFCTEFERSLKMTWVDFMSQFGGNCGLCLGISLLSVIEIFYWFSIKLCKNFKF